MSHDTKIEYADATINWWAGCTQISPACDHCYAKPFAKRLFGVDWGTDAPRHQFQGAYASLTALDRKAKRLGRPLVVFHNSLSDFFDNAVPVQWRIAAMRGIVDTPNLIHLLVTKRIGNAAFMLDQAYRAIHGHYNLWQNNVLPNVWLIATISTQAEADRDIAKLLATPADKRGLSMEPLLGSVDLRLKEEQPCTMCVSWNCELHGMPKNPPCLRSVDWVIVGGESGHNARPMHPDWVRSLRDQCRAAGVPFFFKQWGEWLPGSQACDIENQISLVGACEKGWKWDNGTHSWNIGKKAAGRLLDGRTWDEVPA